MQCKTKRVSKRPCAQASIRDEDCKNGHMYYNGAKVLFIFV